MGEWMLFGLVLMLFCLLVNPPGLTARGQVKHGSVSLIDGRADVAGVIAVAIVIIVCLGVATLDLSQ